MKRFLPWLIPIVALLVAIPVLLTKGAVLEAKIAGIAVAVLTSLSVRVWSYRAGKVKTRPAKVKFTINERYTLNEAFPYYKVLPKPGKAELEERAGLLLAEIAFDNYDHSDVNKENSLLFSVVLAILVKQEAYVDCNNKVVVFWDKEEVEMGKQGEQPILFIRLAELISGLKTATNDNLEAVIAGHAVGKLRDFYLS